MRVMIVAFGSRGDVAPFTGVGSSLVAAGHTVTVAAHAPFRELITAAGLGFHLLPGDIGAMLALPQDDPSPRFMARRVGLLTDLLRQAGRAAVTAAEDADLLLVNGSSPFAFDIAEGLGLPAIGVYSQPMAPTVAHPPVLLNSARSWGRANRLVGDLTIRTLYPFHRAAGELRAELGLPRRSETTGRAQATIRWPVLHGYSPAVLPRPADWRPGLEVVGYWWPAPDPAWTPPPRLVEFLAAGPPPVAIGFGSMAAGQGERLAGVAVEALRAAGLRGVLQAGWAGLDAAADDVLTIGDVPHDWLFPRVAAVVHHAGAGTTGATLRAGVPSVPVPVFADQPLWAQRLVQLGAAPAALPLRHLDAESLAAALRAAVRDPGRAAAAGRLAERIRAEDGAGAVVRRVPAR